MLRIVLTITAASGKRLVYDDGEIGNITNLDAISSYEVLLDGRKVSAELHGYPRWSEPVRGLLARCIDVAELDSDLVQVPEDWTALRVDIGIQSGRQRHPTRLAMCCVTRETGTFNVGFLEGKLSGFIEDVQPRESYQDMWDLAQHALNVSVWNLDAIPAVRPIEIKNTMMEGGFSVQTCLSHCVLLLSTASGIAASHVLDFGMLIGRGIWKILLMEPVTGDGYELIRNRLPA